MLEERIDGKWITVFYRL